MNVNDPSTTRFSSPSLSANSVVYMARESIYDSVSVLGLFTTMEKAIEACDRRVDLYYSDAQGVVRPEWVFCAWESDTLGNKLRKNAKEYVQKVTKEVVS